MNLITICLLILFVGVPALVFYMSCAAILYVYFKKRKQYLKTIKEGTADEK